MARRGFFTSSSVGPQKAPQLGKVADKYNIRKNTTFASIVTVSTGTIIPLLTLLSKYFAVAERQSDSVPRAIAVSEITISNYS